eukprot:scaffold10533_cov273-Chaetoceros_neogracile.AAC.6
MWGSSFAELANVAQKASELASKKAQEVSQSFSNTGTKLRAEEDERQLIKVETRGAARLQQQAHSLQAIRLKAEEEKRGKSRRRTFTYRSRE